MQEKQGPQVTCVSCHTYWRALVDFLAMFPPAQWDAMWYCVSKQTLCMVLNFCLLSWASMEIKSFWITHTKSAHTTWLLWWLSQPNGQRQMRRQGRCQWKLTSTKPVFRKDQWNSCCLVSQGIQVWNLWPVIDRVDSAVFLKTYFWEHDHLLLVKLIKYIQHLYMHSPSLRLVGHRFGLRATLEDRTLWIIGWQHLSCPPWSREVKNSNSAWV